MHAVVQRSLGGPEVLAWTRVPAPEPGPGQVRIRVEVAGVHRVDTLIRSGTGGPGARPALPMIPGREVAGEVDAVGPDVDTAWYRRTVVAHLGSASGGYAELAVADTDALHPVPDGLDPAEAVAMVGTGRTAMAVLGAASLEPADRVLVLAAAGGLGALLVQAAATDTTAAVGAASHGKTEVVASLGVPTVAYDEPGWTRHVSTALGGPPTVVIDPVGGRLGRAAFESLPPGGRHVLVGAASGAATALDADDLLGRGVTAVAGLGPHLAGDRDLAQSLQRQALTRLTDGAWTPLLSPFALSDATGAHRAIEQRTTVGKVVLRSWGRRPRRCRERDDHT